MLDLTAIDLSSLCDALEDHSGDTRWWFDPETGEVEPWPAYSFASDEPDEDHPAERDWLPVEPVPSWESYQDLVDFSERVRNPRARDLLERAIEGRGAFRRFRDTVSEFPELREAWHAFHRTRMERRALRWLADEEVVAPELVQRAIDERSDPDPAALSGAFDAFEIAKVVASDLRKLYGGRLRRVALFGSWAREDAHPESDIDLLVVLDRLESPWEELARMDEILDRHSVAHGTVISAMPVAEADLVEPTAPAVARAVLEGRPVA